MLQLNITSASWHYQFPRSNIIAHNTKIKQVYDTVAAQLVVPTKGINQNWDYSWRFTNPNDTFDLTTFDAATIPYNTFFPGATHASFLRAPLRILSFLFPPM